MRLCRLGLVTFVATTISMLSPAIAADPATELGGKIGALFRALGEPALQGRVVERREVIRRFAADIFDFHESARRVLGSHWAARTPEEQARFVSAFTGLIDHAYLRRIDEYDGERVVVAGQSVDGDQATVHAQVFTRDGETIPVDFLMAQGDADCWRVYDVNVSGMSLVASYRAQFNRIIRTGSYEELLKRLEMKGASAQR
jgi:phospholipid transport system substrate-binding protein